MIKLFLILGIILFYICIMIIYKIYEKHEQEKEKRIQVLEKRIFGEKWTHYDDNIWSVLVHKFANSMECINKTLYIHISFSIQFYNH